MSDYASLISSARISAPEFTAFLRRLGGHVSSEERLDGGVSTPDGAVWFYDARKDLGSGAAQVDRRAQEKLGDAARVRIDFELSSRPGSQQVMLDVAVAFIETWPGVMQCAMQRVMPFPFPAEIAGAVAEDEEKLILGPELRLYFASDVEERMLQSLTALDRLTLCAPVGQAAAPTAEVLMKSNIAELVPEDVMGWIEAESGRVWLSHLFEIEPEEGAVTQHLSATVRDKLGAEAHYFSQLAIGYGASRASEALCLRVAQRLLEDSPGVSAGLFDAVLDANAIRRLASARRGFIE